MLLVSGRFAVSQTIIPEAQEHFLTPSAHRDTHIFGGLGLRNAGHEIKCVHLQPHRNGDDILVESSVVIPLPEASDYQTQLGQREQETRLESSGKARTDQGAGAFKESIGRAPEKFQLRLNWLYDAATSMEQEKIVELSTYTSRKGDYIRLELRVPGKELFLVSFNNLLWSGKERGGEISFWPTEDGLAPNSLRTCLRSLKYVKLRLLSGEG